MRVIRGETRNTGDLKGGYVGFRVDLLEVHRDMKLSGKQLGNRGLHGGGQQGMKQWSRKSPNPEHLRNGRPIED